MRYVSVSDVKLVSAAPRPTEPEVHALPSFPQEIPSMETQNKILKTTLLNRRQTGTYSKYKFSTQ